MESDEEDFLANYEMLRCASAPSFGCPRPEVDSGLPWTTNSSPKAVCLTTPRRQLRGGTGVRGVLGARARRLAHKDTPCSPTGGDDPKARVCSSGAAVAASPSGQRPLSSAGRTTRPTSGALGSLEKRDNKRASRPQTSNGIRQTGASLDLQTPPYSTDGGAVGSTARPGSVTSLPMRDSEDLEGEGALRKEVCRLRKRLHSQACEFQKTKGKLELTELELRQARSAYDELRLKHSNLERIERATASDLLEERRKNEEYSKQVKALMQNIIILSSSVEAGGQQEATGLQKRCFKLVQQNTALAVQSSLLKRQKGWAEAKARVLQGEVTDVYLGKHDQVKGAEELEAASYKEFAAAEVAGKQLERRRSVGSEATGLGGGVHSAPPRKDDPRIFKLAVPIEYQHKEAVVDFLTHITHTNGKDIHGFLQSNSVFSESIRHDCLSGLGREFFALWRQNRLVPQILRAVERVIHLKDYLTAFESFATEIMSLLGCSDAKLWLVDNFAQSMSNVFRGPNDSVETYLHPIPQGQEANDLTGRGFAVAACISQRVVNVSNANEDPRFCEATDRHARSIMCVPVLQRGKQQVKAVLQAVNKLQEPHFDPETDARVLQLLGRISMEVVQVCESSGEEIGNAKRTEALLKVFGDYTPCREPEQLLKALDQGLKKLFRAHSVALHLVTGNGQPHDQLSLTQLEFDGKEVTEYLHPMQHSKSRNDGPHGLVGLTAKTMNNQSLPHAQLEQSSYDPAIDLEVPERSVLHTVPICASSACVAVCQFVCPERDRSFMGDDGTFQQENRGHFNLLRMLLSFVQKHLHDVFDVASTQRQNLASTPRPEQSQFPHEDDDVPADASET